MIEHLDRTSALLAAGILAAGTYTLACLRGRKKPELGKVVTMVGSGIGAVGAFAMSTAALVADPVKPMDADMRVYLGVGAIVLGWAAGEKIIGEIRTAFARDATTSAAPERAAPVAAAEGDTTAVQRPATVPEKV